MYVHVHYAHFYVFYDHSCGAGIGLALWILESYVVLLDATDLQNVKGCTVTPPYLDEYGEPDPGLRSDETRLVNDVYIVTYTFNVHTHTHTHTHTNVHAHTLTQTRESTETKQRQLRRAKTPLVSSSNPGENMQRNGKE